jgi:hypothetical protein
MINVTKLLAGLLFVFCLVATSYAGSIISAGEGFKVYQSDTADDDDDDDEEEEKKKKEGEEEEPDC